MLLQVVCVSSSKLNILHLTKNSKIFARTLFSRNFAYAKVFENKTLRNGKIALSFTEIGKSCLSPDFFTSLICLLMLFAKIKVSRKFPNLQRIELVPFYSDFVLFSVIVFRTPSSVNQSLESNTNLFLVTLYAECKLCSICEAYIVKINVKNIKAVAA